MIRMYSHIYSRFGKIMFLIFNGLFKVSEAFFITIVKQEPSGFVLHCILLSLKMRNDVFDK